MVSNCVIPQTIYKILISSADLILKNLGNCFVGVVTGNTTKVLFPCRKDSTKMRIWVNSSQIHEGSITSLEHCGGIKSISGD